MDEPPPLSPYALVRLAGPEARPWYDDRRVPLEWLADWRRALDPPVYYLPDNKQPRREPPIFTCFYDPVEWYHWMRPVFKGLPRLRNWPQRVWPILCSCQPFVCVPHAIVKRHAHRSSEFTVPISWIRNADELKRQFDDGSIPPADKAATVWECYFDPKEMKARARYHVKIEMHDFGTVYRNWHAVNVLGIFEGELVRAERLLINENIE